MNDALLPEETIKLLRGEKIGTGTVKATFLPGRIITLEEVFKQL